MTDDAAVDTSNCELEIQAVMPTTNSMKHVDHLVALPCRECGAAEIRRVTTQNEVFYDGW